MHPSMCYFGNCPALPCPVVLVISEKANQQFFSCGQSRYARMVAGSCSSTSLTSCISALNCADLHQIWLSSQTGAVSSLKEILITVFTGVHMLMHTFRLLSICFWKLSQLTWKQGLLSKLLQMRNQCLSTLEGEMVRWPCLCYRLSQKPVSFHVGLPQINRSLDLLPREYK